MLNADNKIYDAQGYDGGHKCLSHIDVQGNTKIKIEEPLLAFFLSPLV